MIYKSFLKKSQSKTFLTLTLALLAGIKTASAADPNPDSDATESHSSSEVRQLREKLFDNETRIGQLEAENVMLRKQLGLPPINLTRNAPQKSATPAAVSQSDQSLVQLIELPQIKWGTPAAADKHQLLAGIPGASIVLVPFDKTLVIKQVTTARLALSLRKVSKSLGTESFTDAGSLWVQNGSLYLQWVNDDQLAALNIFKYASLEVRDRPDDAPKIYSFVHPETVAVELNKQPATKTSIPPLLIPEGKLRLQHASDDWKPATEKDGAIELENKALQLQVKLDPAGCLSAHYDAIDPNHAQRKLDALNTRYAKTQSDLQGFLATDKTPPKYTPGYSAGGLDYPAVYENRDYLHRSIQSAKEELANMERERPKLEAAVAGVRTKASAIADLDGTIVELALPNGVVVSQMKLQVAH